MKVDKSTNRILDAITKPTDTHCLNVEQLQILCGEIRAQIIETTHTTGGHVASSLGAVELIVAAHSVLNVPYDKLLFDVGHQSYTHMLLCGRCDCFDTLRQYGGFSGFPRPALSKYDSSVSGHASDSISVAAGYALASRIEGKKRSVACIIGDASIEGGMALEALSYIGANQLPVVVILNDNGMSISNNVGAITRNLGLMRTSKRYRTSKDSLQHRIENKGPVGKIALDLGTRTKDAFKHMLFPHEIIFEEMGFLCTPAINGNNIAEVRETLLAALKTGGPVLIHATTKKGLGYKPAEDDPEKFHGIGAFDIKTGQTTKKKKPYWTDVFGKKIAELAEKNENIVAITAAMEGGCGLKEFHSRFEDRFVDVGICEENAVGIASGLSYSGKLPIVCIYSTFLQRAYDQMLIDVCLESRHCVFAIDRAGIVGADGPTHHGLFDIAFLRSMPNMTVITPSDARELEAALESAVKMDGPVAIRYPRGEVGEALSDQDYVLKLGEFSDKKSRTLIEGEDVAILAFGKMVRVALSVAKTLESEGVSARVVDMRFAKPIDELAVKSALSTKLIATIEDGILQGGAGEAVSSLVAGQDKKKKPKVINFAFDNKFVLHGSDEELYEGEGLSPKAISVSILESL